MRAYAFHRLSNVIKQLNELNSSLPNGTHNTEAHFENIFSITIHYRMNKTRIWKKEQIKRYFRQHIQKFLSRLRNGITLSYLK